MNDKEFIAAILAIPAESRTIEFKRVGASRNDAVDRVLQSVVAMANTDGGVIVLGIDDPEKSTTKAHDRIFGIEENIQHYDELGHSVKKIAPPIPSIWPPRTIHVPERNCRVGVLSVPKVCDHFRTIENHVYVRLEKGNKLLSPQEIVHFSYIKGFQRADSELVDIDFDLLRTSLYDAWRRKRNIPDDAIKVVLQKTGLARLNDARKSMPTRAAVLLFAEFPNDLMDTKCTVRVFQYSGSTIEVKGDTLNLIGTPRTISGPIIRQITDAHEYVLTLLRNGVRVPGGFVTTYQIPDRAVKEAITNAVIHRDYSTKKDIEVRIFDNRVEVESPGLLPFNITPGNIGHARAFGYRNDLLVKHLREFPDPPNLDQNEGVRAMREKMREAHLFPPSFVTYPALQDSVRLVLLNEKAPSEWEKIRQYLLLNKYVGNKEARDVLGQPDTVKVSRLFNRWVDQGVLVKVSPRPGSKRNVRYRLPDVDDNALFAPDAGK